MGIESAPRRHIPNPFNNPEAGLATAYVIFAVIWFLLSDVILVSLGFSHATASFVKNFIFVLVSVFFAYRTILRLIVTEGDGLSPIQAGAASGISPGEAYAGEDIIEAIFESTADGMLVVDKAGKIIRFNSKLLQMWGMPTSVAEEGESDKIFDYASQLMQNPVMGERDFKSANNSDEIFSDSVRLKDGRVFNVYSCPLWHESRVEGRVWSFRDITERKKVEWALADSERKNRAIVSALPDLMFRISAEGEFLDYHAPSEDMLFVPPDKIIGGNLRDMGFPPEAVDIFEKTIEASLKTGEVQINEYQLPTPSGSAYFEERIIPSGPNEVISLVRDVSDRKKWEESLQLTQMFIDRASVSAFMAQPDGRFIYVNDEACRSLGYSKDELLDKSVFDINVQTDEEVWSNLKLELKERPSLGFEFEHVTKEGEVFPVDLTLTYLEYSGHEYYFAFARDVTEKRRAEKALRDSEERYRLLAENTDDVIWTMNIDLNETTYISPAIERLRGYTVEEHLSQPLDKIITPYSMQKVLEILALAREVQSSDRPPVPISRTFEIDYIHKDGSIVPCEVRATFMLDESGKPVAIHGVSRDISRRRKAEERTRVQRDLGLALSANLGMDKALSYGLDAAIRMADMDCGGIYIIDERTGDLELKKHIGLSDEFVKSTYHLGSDSPHVRIIMSGRTIYKAYGDLDLPKDEVRKKEGLKAMAVIPLHYLDSVVGCLNISSHTLNEVPPDCRDTLEVTAAHIGSVAARIMAEEALRESERRLELAVWGAELGIWDADLEKNEIVISGRLSETLGYEKDEIGKDPEKWLDLVHPDDRENLEEIFFLHADGDVPYFQAEFRIRAKNGEYRWMQVRGAVVAVGKKGQATRATGVHLDVTERKRAEEALRHSEERFRALSEQNLLAIGILQDGIFKYVNEAGAGIAEEPADEIMTWSAMDFLDIVHPDYRGFVLDQARRKQEGLDGQVANYVLKSVTKTGKEKWIDLYSKTITFDGRPADFVTMIDVTDKKKAEDDLEAEKERLAVTLRSIGDGVITTDVEGTIILMNRVAEELTGYSQRDAEGKNLGKVFKIVNEITRKPAEDPVRKVMETGGIIGLPHHTVLVARDGVERVIADSGAPIRDRDSKIIGVVLVFRDVTEKRKMEEELLKAEKLESLGVLAGGIAHDFNNILTGVLGNISMARLQTANKEKTVMRLEEAEKACVRAKELTRQLLTYARGGAPIKTISSLKSMVLESAWFALRGSNVSLEYEMPEDLWPAEVDEGQIGQVIQNLIINADQAMPEGGNVRVKASNFVLDEDNALLLPGSKHSEYVKIEVIDQGIGIPEEHLSGIFDPFFTTKQRGSGLGLATAYSIVKRHEGHILVDSQIGRGTTFSIYLPASPHHEHKIEQDKQEMVKGKGKVLVMDDEETILELLGVEIPELGYEVELAASGEEAIKLYRESMENNDKFDAVILDLTVRGGMGGKEALEKMLAFDPEVKGIVSSGYSTDAIMSNYKQYGFKGVIAKPYRPEELSLILMSVINGED